MDDYSNQNAGSQLSQQQRTQRPGAVGAMSAPNSDPRAQPPAADDGLTDAQRSTNERKRLDANRRALAQQQSTAAQNSPDPTKGKQVRDGVTGEPIKQDR